MTSPVPAIERLEARLIDVRSYGDEADPQPVFMADLRTALARIRELEGAVKEAGRAMKRVDDALEAMADAGATPAHGTWQFVKTADRNLRAALSQSPAMEKTDG